MARTALVPQDAVITGLEATFTAANVDGHKFIADERYLLVVDNGSGGDVDVTTVTAVTVGGRAVPDDVCTVTAGEVRYIGPFVRAVHGQAESVGADAGQVYVNFESVSSVTVALIKV